jgi:hypothetical protein
LDRFWEIGQVSLRNLDWLLFTFLWSPSPILHILFGEWCCIAPVKSFIRLGAPGEGSRGHEAPHRAVVLEFVLDGVDVVWISLLKEPLEVVYRHPCRQPAAARGGRDAPHARAAHFPAAVLIAVGHGRSPWRALLALLVTASDVVLGAVSCIIERRLVVAAWGRLLAHLCGAVYGRLVVGGVLGGDAVRLLEHAPKEVALPTLSRVLLVATGTRGR